MDGLEVCRGSSNADVDRSIDKNGLYYPWDLIEAVSHSGDPRIGEALLRVFERADQGYVIAAALSSWLVENHRDTVMDRLVSCLDPSGSGSIDTGYSILGKAARVMNEESIGLFDVFLKGTDIKRCKTVCHVFADAEEIEAWAPLVLGRFLGDTRDTGEKKHGYAHTMRVCDLAVVVLSRHLGGGELVLADELGARDKQITAIEERILLRVEDKRIP